MTHYDFDAFINDGTLKEIKMAPKFYPATVTYTDTDGSAKTIVAKIRHENGQVFYIKPGGRKERFLCMQQYIINEWSEATIR